MITLFVALYSLLCLCTTGNTSDIKELQVKTVKPGEAVTMECNNNEQRSNLAWYRQSFGKVPQFLARQYGGPPGYIFAEGFNDNRFSVTVKDQTFDLNINETREDDGGEYFCGYVWGSTVKFTSGTRLQFEGEEMKPCPTPGTLNKNTHSVTHQGSNSTLMIPFSQEGMSSCPSPLHKHSHQCYSTDLVLVPNLDKKRGGLCQDRQVSRNSSRTSYDSVTQMEIQEERRT
ncbi:uncharacterized protein LOC128514927 [Clarias gariepinus]|uniref:uncharacterized protein LOC128514927 n=1 Tax=Clarias gariepinus TaxID=13013 RepID=UPI00234D7EC6|nr:uncharacterized protein LOC128514927 [Clarias gariepinus]